MKPSFITASDAFLDWRDDLLSGKEPVLWMGGRGVFQRIEVGPGLVVLFGAPPGYGKTALTMQMAIDAARFNPKLRVLIANVEMSVGALLDRQLARLSGIDLSLIRYRKLGAEHADRLERGLAAIDAIAERIAFVGAPFNLENVAEAGDAFGPVVGHRLHPEVHHGRSPI